MAELHQQSATGPAAELAEQVRARVAANAQQVQRTRQRVTRAMIQVRQVDQRLHGEAADDPHWVGVVEHATDLMRSEPAADLRAVERHEQTAELLEEREWPARAAAARAYAADARERSRQAREKLARHQERAAAAGERVRQAQG